MKKILHQTVVVMSKSICATVAWFGFIMFGCAATQTPDPMVQELAKAHENEGILERSLHRCEEQMPSSSEWPSIFSTGFYGNFWLKPPVAGKMLEFNKVTSPTEEQLFIIPRVNKDEPVLLEGKNLRKIEAGVFAIVLYSVPQDPDERKKEQAIVITYSGERFVVIFKPSRGY